MYWDIGEAAVTIIAASIPILRVLFVTMISESHQISNEGVRVATMGSMFSTSRIQSDPGTTNCRQLRRFFAHRVPQDRWVLTTTCRRVHTIVPAGPE
jgi:hypothetical protein